MSSWMIDDYGHAHRSGSSALAGLLGYTAGGDATERYAVENIGFIAITERADRLHIRCRPTVVSDRTIAGLFYWLMDLPNLPIVLSWCDEVWRIERPMTQHVLVSYLGELVAKRSLVAVGGRRILSRTSQTAATRWQHTVGTVGKLIADDHRPHQRQTVLNTIYRGRWSVFDFHPRTGRLDIVDRGTGYPPYHPGMSGADRDFTPKNMIDAEYKAWVLHNFSLAAADRKPRFDDIDAVVQWARTGDIRMRYWRILAPVKAPGASCRMLSVSGCDSGIDLRPNDVQISA